MEMTGVQRHAFLTATVASAGGLLGDRLPGAGIRIRGGGKPFTGPRSALGGIRHPSDPAGRSDPLPGSDELRQRRMPI